MMEPNAALYNDLTRVLVKREDIAEAVYALCGGALPYVTGQSIDVDGGFHIRRL